jgi:uncharacterized protein (TIGR00730 family)
MGMKPSTEHSGLLRSINGGEADIKGGPPTRIGVFCGSRAGARPEYLRTAEEIGQAIAERGGSLIYGAGGVGLMGAVSDAAYQAGAEVIGVIPASLHERERLDNACGEIIVVENMHVRKALMYELADAFVVLPGGYGTMDELMEVATWNQLGFHHRPLVLANINGFFDSLLTFFDRMAIDGFIRQKERGLIRAATDPHACLDALGMARPIGATSLTLLHDSSTRALTDSLGLTTVNRHASAKAAPDQAIATSIRRSSHHRRSLAKAS